MPLDPDVADLLLETVERMEREADETSVAGRCIARRTMLIVNTSMVVIIGMTLLIFVLIVQMSQGLTDLVDNMVDMYGRFGEMAQDMDAITASVHRINTHVEGMPVIASEMSSMNTSVAQMHDDVVGIASSVSSVQKNTSEIDHSVGEMAGHFVALDGTVNRINHSVNQMSRPMYMMQP